MGETASTFCTDPRKFKVETDWPATLDTNMLILDKTTRKLQTPGKMQPYGIYAVASLLALPFGVLSAQHFANPLIGIFVGGSLFAYTVILAGMLKTQAPPFLKMWLRRKHTGAPRSVADLAGVRIDFVGDKGPNELVDGLIHTRRNELQRIIRVTLPKRNQAEMAIWLEAFFEYLSSIQDTRFQIIFPEMVDGKKREMLLIASLILTPPAKGKLDLPPLVRMQELLGQLIEKIVVLGAAPKVLGSAELRLLISNELGSASTRFNLHKDWRHVKNLGWEPSFRDIDIKPNDRHVQLNKHISSALCFDQLPGASSFTWLSTIMSDLPDARLSIFMTPAESGDPIRKFKNAHKYWQHHQEQGHESSEHQTSQMSFFLRFDSNDAYLLENEISMARKFLQSLGVKTKLQNNRQYQLLNWRATLPCATDPTLYKHLIAFTPTRQMTSATD